jgi:hypothetical protein
MFYDKAELKKRLGIEKDFKNWNSYSKHLYSNHVLGYDKEAIYLIDKLSLTYECEYLSTHFDALKRYTNGFHYTYGLSETIELRKEGISKNYHFNYTVIVAGELFGNILIQNTSNYNSVKIEILNQVLYTQPKIVILQTLLDIAVLLDLTFKNISVYELARDSVKNHYDEFCKIQYQSDFCPKQVHEIYSSTPKFSFYRKKLHVSHEVDSKDNAFGTVRIGSNESDTQLKVYVKSNELKSWEEEKNYISAIHAKHFHDSPIITRVEVKANSKAVRKHNWDLLDLFVPENHKLQFFKLLDDKLKFKILASERWDNNRNKKFDVFDLIPHDITDFNVSSVPIDSSYQLTHSKSSNKMRTIVYMYLDNELSTWGMIDFFRKNIWGKPISYKKYNIEIQKAVKNYRNQKGRKFQKKIFLIMGLLKTNGKILSMMPHLTSYLI